MAVKDHICPKPQSFDSVDLFLCWLYFIGMEWDVFLDIKDDVELSPFSNFEYSRCHPRWLSRNPAWGGKIRKSQVFHSYLLQSNDLIDIMFV